MLRDEKILSLLAAGPLTTSQLHALAGFTTRRRAQARLQKLHAAGLIRRTSLLSCGPGRAQYLYYIKRKPKPSAIAHLLGIGDCRAGIAMSAKPLGVAVQEYTGVGLGALIPDALFVLTRNQLSSLLCLEYDRSTERLCIIQHKAQRYIAALESNAHRAVAELASHSFSGFRVLVVCDGKRRLQSMGRVLARVDARPIFWLALREHVLADALGSIWLVAGDKTGKHRALVRG